MHKIRGDLVALFRQGHFDVIVHGQNCHCNMDDGIAKTIASFFPEALQADMATKPYDRSKLGSYTKALVPQGVIINAYTQYDWCGSRPGGLPLTEYPALRDAFRAAMIEFGGRGRRWGVPAIGAARGGGDWGVISAIIDEELPGENVTFVEFDGPDSIYGDYRRNMRRPHG